MLRHVVAVIAPASLSWGILGGLTARRRPQEHGRRPRGLPRAFRASIHLHPSRRNHWTTDKLWVNPLVPRA